MFFCPRPLCSSPRAQSLHLFSWWLSWARDWCFWRCSLRCSTARGECAAATKLCICSRPCFRTLGQYHSTYATVAVAAAAAVDRPCGRCVPRRRHDNERLNYELQVQESSCNIMVTYSCLRTRNSRRSYVSSLRQTLVYGSAIALSRKPDALAPMQPPAYNVFAKNTRART